MSIFGLPLILFQGTQVEVDVVTNFVEFAFTSGNSISKSYLSYNPDTDIVVSSSHYITRASAVGNFIFTPTFKVDNFETPVEFFPNSITQGDDIQAPSNKLLDILLTLGISGIAFAATATVKIYSGPTSGSITGATLLASCVNSSTNTSNPIFVTNNPVTIQPDEFLIIEIINSDGGDDWEILEGATNFILGVTRDVPS